MFEKRYVQAAELRVDDSHDETPTIDGYAIVFNADSVLLWGEFRERIAPGAFDLGGDIRALWNHDSGAVLGRTTAGTLRLWEDDHGVAFSMAPPDNSIGRDALASIRRGDVDQMSFGFSVLPGGERWHEAEGGEIIRTVTSGTLYEVSPVAFPAYPQTSVDARTMTEVYGVKPDIPRGDRAIAPEDTPGDMARARSDVRRRELDLLEIGDTIR